MPPLCFLHGLQPPPPAPSTLPVCAMAIRTSWVVLPVVMAACIMQSLDRGTLAFAAADMNADLGFDAQTYGIASGAQQML